ncbi:MAG: hypothetical protein SFV24_26020 [Gemmatimonadales bacterium]|nr:hypothetical protein [Gemmatimonadales bacterium]
MYSSKEPLRASVQREWANTIEFYWIDDPGGGRGAQVVKTDEHGMRWTLDVGATHFVTQRIAAGLLNVTVMTVNNWVREGRFGQTMKRRGVSVIPMTAVERVAEARGIFINQG